MVQLKHSGPNASTFFNELFELPVPTTGTFDGPNLNVLRVAYSFRDRERKAKRSQTKTFFVPETQEAISTSSFDSTDVLASVVSPSNQRRALLREVSDDKGKKRIVEIWFGSRLEASLDVTEKHEEFNTDLFLSTLSFSPSETALLYSAEAKLDKSTFEGGKADPFDKFRFTPHAGETMYTKKRSTIYLFRWANPGDARSTILPTRTKNDVSLSVLKPVETPAVPVLFGQAVFASEDRIIATGYEYTGDGKLMGVKFCYNKPTALYELQLGPEEKKDDSNTEKSEDKKDAPKLPTVAARVATRLTPPERTVRTPRVLRDENGAATHLFWLSNALGGAHNASATLYSKQLASDASGGQDGEAKALVGPVAEPEPGAFPGIFADDIAQRGFLRVGDTTQVVISSGWGARNTVLLVDASSGAVKELTPSVKGEPQVSYGLLCTDGRNRVVCSRHSPTLPPEVVLGTVDAKGGVSWKVIDTTVVSTELDDALKGLEYSVVPITGRKSVEAIHIGPKSSATDDKKPYSLLMPHGGPHANSMVTFSYLAASFALDGYTLCSPNYTGSTGYGENFVQGLIGNCGSLDVEDCIAAARHFNDQGISENGKWAIWGGSHGGFLTGHLIGQYPDFFRAAILCNPVISLGEISTSDIPDWYYAECGLPFTPATLMTPEMYAKLWAVSPISYVDNVKTPALLCVGEADKRVAPTQGIGYYHALKGRNKVVEMLTFPGETHAMDGVECAATWYEATRDWIRAWTS
ncbi:alpha beta-hydrolase [Coniophora puteana RWD-64-598 SS2]|uniref:acylaminoacyl-peptidase n=1 Tax=Coniophora puteana (strain RWD-64-598) TaxID=741705 RepID=A0A5M3MCE2_CONPW|nr:alpha beta-hydrolase [Coniophora puteana RWD-64-598 SS2]EIW76889.1 alpha beta-hydrolase [Coniophora puteana RWD-64-598 SS2]